MRIGFTGSSGTGKSTLATYVAERYGLPLNPVGSRSVSAAMGFASPYDVDAAGKRAEFQRRLLADKAAWEAERETFVSDRTVVDCLTYLALHDVRSIDEALLDLVGRGLARYTHIFYCPVSAFCETGDDSSRVHDMAYQRVFDGALVGLLAKFGTQTIRLHSGDLGFRKRMLDTVLDGDPWSG